MGPEWIGQPFILVPKDKLLFAYEPAPEGGIVLPSMQRSVNIRDLRNN